MDPMSDEESSSHDEDAPTQEPDREKKKSKLSKKLNIFEQVESINDDAISAAAKKVDEFYKSIESLEFRLNHSKKMLRQIKMNKPPANAGAEESVESLNEGAENRAAMKLQVVDTQEQLDSANAKFVESLSELRQLLHPDYFEFICTHFRKPASLEGLQWPLLEMGSNFNPFYSVFADIKSLDDWVVMALFWEIHPHCGRLKQLQQHCTKVEAEMKSLGSEPDLVGTEETMENLKTEINLLVAAISERTPPDLLVRFCQIFNITTPPPNSNDSGTKADGGNATSEKPLPDDKLHVLAEINGFGLKKVNELTMKVNNIRDEIAAQRKAHHFHLRCQDLKIYPPYLSWQPELNMEEKSPALVMKLKEKHLSEHIASIQSQIQKLEAELNDTIAQLKELLPPSLCNRYRRYYGGDVEVDISEVFRITTFKMPEMVSAPAEKNVVDGSGKNGKEDRVTQMAQSTESEPTKVHVAVEDSGIQNQQSSDITVGVDVGSAQHAPPTQLQNADEPPVLAEINALGDETVSQLALKVKELGGMIALAHKQKRLQSEASQNQTSSSQLSPQAEKASSEVWNYVKKLEVERKEKMFVLKQLLPPDLYKRYYQCFGGRVVTDLEGKLEKPKTSAKSVLNPSEGLAGKTPFGVHRGFQLSTAKQKTVNELRSKGGVGNAPGKPSSRLKRSRSSNFGKQRIESEVTKKANALVAKLKRNQIAKWKQTTEIAFNAELSKLKLSQVGELTKTLHPKLPPCRLDLYSVRNLPATAAIEKTAGSPARNKRHVGIDGLLHSELHAANSLVSNLPPQVFDYGHTADSASAKLGISEMLGAVLQPQLRASENYLVINSPEQTQFKNMRSSRRRNSLSPSRRRRAIPSSRSPGRRNIRSSPSSRRRAVPSSHSPRRRNNRSSPSPKRQAFRSSRSPHPFELDIAVSQLPDYRTNDYFDEQSLQLKGKTGLGLDSSHQHRHRARGHRSRSPEHNYLDAEYSLQFDSDAVLVTALQQREHGANSRRLRSPDSARHRRHRTTARLSPSPHRRFGDNFHSEGSTIPYRSLSLERGNGDHFDSELKIEDDFYTERTLHPEHGIIDGYFVSDLPFHQESMAEYRTGRDANSEHSRHRNGPPLHHRDSRTPRPLPYRRSGRTPPKRSGRSPPKDRSRRTPTKRSDHTPPKGRSGHTPPKRRSDHTTPPSSRRRDNRNISRHHSPERKGNDHFDEELLLQICESQDFVTIND